MSAFMPDGGINALSGLRSVRPAFNLFTMLAETAGVGGLKIPGGAAAYRGYSAEAIRFPAGATLSRATAPGTNYLWLNRRAMRSSFIINSSVTPTSTMVSAEPSAILPRSVRLKMATGSVVQPGG